MQFHLHFHFICEHSKRVFVSLFASSGWSFKAPFYLCVLTGRWIGATQTQRRISAQGIWDVLDTYLGRLWEVRESHTSTFEVYYCLCCFFFFSQQNYLWYVGIVCLDSSSITYHRVMGEGEQDFIYTVLALISLKEPSGFNWVTTASLVTLRLACGSGVGEMEPSVLNLSLCDLPLGSTHNNITEPSSFFITPKMWQESRKWFSPRVLNDSPFRNTSSAVA